MANVTFEYGTEGAIQVRFTQIKDLAYNKSTIRIDGVYAKCSRPSSNDYYPAFAVKINGSTAVDLKVFEQNKFKISTANAWVLIPNSSGTNTVEVSHNADGTGTVTLSVTENSDHNTIAVSDSPVGGSSYAYYSQSEVTKSVSLDTLDRTFVLSISAGTGSSVIVNRTSSPSGSGSIGSLDDNATIYYGDVLKISFRALTGYDINIHKVNDASFTSGHTCTVRGAINVTATATLKTFTLSISAGTGSSIVVNRTSSPLGNGSTGDLSNGATIYYNDVLRVSYDVTTGCTIETHTINESQFISGTDHTVTSAVSVVTTATVNPYELVISAGANTTVTVNRTSSPLGKATTGYIQNGSIIYYNDVLNISWVAATGYTVTISTVNDVTESSGESYTVTEDILVAVAATVNSYSIISTVDAHAELIVTRTASPKAGAQTGIITDSVIYFGDVISIQAVPASGYGIDNLKVDAVEVTNPKSITVTDDVIVVVLVKALGFIYIDSGSSIEKYKIIIDSGSAMEQYRAMIDTGSAIVPY